MKKQNSGINKSENVEERMAADDDRLLDELRIFGESRRKFLGQAVGGLGAFALTHLQGGEIFAGIENAPESAAQIIENAVKVVLKINGDETSLNVDSRMTLLDALRERLNLTGSKKGCDHGQCGACTVIVDGRRVLSCLTLTATCEGKSVTTIEGLAKGDSFCAEGYGMDVCRR